MKIGTYIFSFVLIILLLFNSTRITLTYAYYTLDPIGFIEDFCENLDKPELKCLGKCQLKKVAVSQDKEQKTPERIINFKELTLFSSAFESIVFTENTYVKKQQPKVYNNLYTYSNISDCFHPPQV